jgi:hypothetical protein
MPSIRSAFALLATCLCLALPTLGASALDDSGGDAGGAGSDPEAVRVADRLMTALGGREAWEATHFIEFGFFGRRSHVWDKYTGRHRVEGETQDGVKYVVIHDIDDKGEGDGKVFLDGEPVTGDEKSQWLQRAYASWVNDAYWLVMPYKLRDPGVHLTYEGTEDLGGQSYDVVHLSFDHVGLTPGDQYWAYINRDTGLMDRWAYHLQSMGPDDPRTVWDWKGWARYGDIYLAPTREQVGQDRTLSLAPISVPDSVPDSVFEGP